MSFPQRPSMRDSRLGSVRASPATSATPRLISDASAGELEGLLREMNIALQEARAENTRKSSSPGTNYSGIPDSMTVSSSGSSGPVQSPLPEAIFTPGVNGEDSMVCHMYLACSGELIATVFQFSSTPLHNSGTDMFVDSSTTSMSQSVSWDSLDSFSNNVYSPAAEADFGILPDTDASVSYKSDTTIALTTYDSHTAQAGQNMQLVPSGWPPNLPTPEVTRHL